MLQRNRELETSLAQQGKMASLGVLSSGVAHEINNPLGVILGYAAYLEKKLPEDDPNFHYIHEIKRESKRCKKIVQDLLSYARTPQPELAPTDLNQLLDQIVDFAANHTDLFGVKIVRDFDPQPAAGAGRRRPDPPGGDQPDPQCRRGHGRQGVTHRAAPPAKRNVPSCTFADTGCGIAEEDLGGSSSRSTPPRSAAPGWGWRSPGS